LSLDWIRRTSVMTHATHCRFARVMNGSARWLSGYIRQYEGTQLFASISGAMVL
jgi:hypothetical protein